MPEWQAYHDMTSAQHQTKFTDFSSRGFRMISLSVYGDPSNPRYAAVWIRRQGPAYVAFHGRTPTEYQQFFNEQTANGYRPILISATGGGVLPTVFAGLFEAGTMRFCAVHGISAGQLKHESDNQRNSGLVMRWLCVYGNPLNPLYTAIWEENVHAINWSIELGDDGDTYQQKFNAYVAGRMRPTCVSIAGKRGLIRYASLWYDDQFGDWYAFHGLTARDYQQKIDDMAAQGFMLIHVQGGGDWSNPRFTAIFARDDQPRQRIFAVRGQSSPGLESFDHVMQNFMEANNIRAGQLAVVRRGRLVYARAFTNAETGFPVTEPTTVFRAASVCKTITAMAVHVLIEQHHLTLHRKMQEILNLQTPSGGLPDADFARIEVWHLLSHCSGMDDHDQSERSERKVANAFGVSLPVTRDQLARFEISRQLSNSPGYIVEYNDIGFFMLGQIIDAQTGVSYEQYVQDKVFAPMGVTRAKVAAPLLQNALPGEVWYQPVNPGVGRSVMSPNEPFVPTQYGTWDTALGAAMGGWAFAAADYARLWASFDIGAHSPVMRPETAQAMWTNPFGLDGENSQKEQVLSGWWRHRWQDDAGVPIMAIGHNGSFAGTASVLWRRSDGISVVVLFNRDISLDFMGNSPFGKEMNAAIKNVRTWPSKDLFPYVGLSSICDDRWRWCSRCRVLFRLGGKSKQSCPAGHGGHSGIISAAYTLIHSLPAARGQWGWQRCRNCEALWFAGSGSNGHCPASSDGLHRSGSTDYVLAKDENPNSPGQPGWRWCSRCQSLWFSGNSTKGVCAAGPGGHSSAGSGNYRLLMF